MDSSRGGPLTTLIMMLPLIVVPAIAMLRPLDLQNGLTSGPLSASQEDEDFAELSEFGFDDPAQAKPVNSREVSDYSMSDGVAGLSAPLFSGAQTAENEAHDASFPFGSSPAASTANEPDFTPWMTQLNAMGATRTLWFQPATGSEGFVAFVPVANADRVITYRFEAIAADQTAALENVTMQIRQWQASRTNP